MACPRIAYRRRTHYATRSNRFKMVRTPGNRLVAQKREKRSQGPHCPWSLGHTRLAGTKALGHNDRRLASRYRKSVSRPYGGVLTHEQVRDRIVRAFLIEEQRIVKKVIAAEQKFQHEKKRRDLKKKKRIDRVKVAVKKVGAKKAAAKTTLAGAKKVVKAPKKGNAPVGAKVVAAKPAAKKPVAKAAAKPAAKAARKDTVSKTIKPTKVVAVKKRKAFTRPQFRRPHTFRKAKAAKPNNNLKSIKNPWDEFRVIRYPLTTDMAMKKIEENNTLTFIVDPRSNKTSIKKAMKALYQVKSAKVNTLIRPDGLKKAYIRLAATHDALDIANKIGIL